MSFIDWSDPEEMFGLLVEYIADETGATQADADRRQFLEALLADLITLEQRFSELSDVDGLVALQGITSAIDVTFKDDPAVEHLNACVGELQRICEQQVS